MRLSRLVCLPLLALACAPEPARAPQVQATSQVQLTSAEVSAPAPAPASMEEPIIGPPEHCEVTATETTGCRATDEVELAPLRRRLETCRGSADGKVVMTVRR